MELPAPHPVLREEGTGGWINGQWPVHVMKPPEKIRRLGLESPRAAEHVKRW